jgi:hypothetical protein
MAESSDFTLNTSNFWRNADRPRRIYAKQTQFRPGRKLSRLSWEFDLRSSNRERLYATASCLSRTRVNALSSIGN